MFVPESMIPATNWFAISGDETDGFEIWPLACWALGSDEDDVSIIYGMIADDEGNIVPATTLENFVGYDLFDDTKQKDDTTITNMMN